MGRALRSIYALSALVATAAFACPVCGLAGAGNQQGQEAYKYMSVILSLLPLAAAGGLVFYLARKSRAANSSPSRE